MGRIRKVAAGVVSPLDPCCRCFNDRGGWDRIAGKPLCPDCQENLARGEGPPLIERCQASRCAVCGQVGTIRYLTFPLRALAPIEMDLCPEHLRGLLGRQLTPSAYLEIRRQLRQLGLSVGEIFLLHDTFYTDEGDALHRVSEPDYP